MSSNSTYRTTNAVLLQQYSRSPSVELRNRIVTLNVGLVRKVAHRVASYSGESYEDLEQVGQIGLLRAVERFSPSAGTTFSTYAVVCIRGALHHYLRDRANIVRIPRWLQELNSRAKKAEYQLLHSLGRQPTAAEIAAALDIPVEKLERARLAMANRSPLELDAPLTDGEGGTFADRLPDPAAAHQMAATEDAIAIRQAIEKLPPLQRQAVSAVYLRGLGRRGLGRELGMTEQSAGRWVRKGVQQLKGIMAR